MGEHKKRVGLRRVLIIFFCVIALLTILSKVANSIIVPRVTVDEVSKGAITHDISGQGVLVAAKESNMDVPSNIKVESIKVKTGQKVSVGDPLVVFDLESVEEAIATSYEELLEEERAYQEKKTSYENLLNKTEWTKAQKAAKKAQEKLEEAKANYEVAQKKYDEKMVKLTSELEETQLEDYEKVTEEKKEAEQYYKKCQEDYEKMTKEAEEVLQEAVTNQGNLFKDTQRELESATLAYSEFMKDFNRVNGAFNAYVTCIDNKDLDSDNSLRNQMICEVLGQSRYDMFISSQIPDLSAYEEALSIYNDIVVAALEYQNAVTSVNQAGTEQLREDAQRKVEAAKKKLYSLVVKPFEVDKVTAHEKELAVTVKQEALDVLSANNEKNLRKAETAYNDTIKEAKETLDKAKKAYDKSVSEYNKVMEKVYEDSDQEENLLSELNHAKDQFDLAQDTWEEANEALTEEERESISSNDLLSLSEYTLEAAKQEINQKTGIIEQLEQLKQQVGILSSEVEGTVSHITLENYKVTNQGDRIIIASNDCYFEGSFPKELFPYVEVGDQILLNLQGHKDPIEIIVDRVYVNPESATAGFDATMKQGDYILGAIGSFIYSKTEMKSDHCVPITALRQDSIGYYVLVPKESSSILGHVIKASRVDVTVIKKDAKRAVIDSFLTNGDSVITGSNKMIQDGDTIRLGQ